MVVEPRRGFPPPSRPGGRSKFSGDVLGIATVVIVALAIILALIAILISSFCNTSDFEDRRQPELDQQGVLNGGPIQLNRVYPVPNYSPVHPPQHFSGFQPQLEPYPPFPRNTPALTRGIRPSGDLMSNSNVGSNEASPSNQP